MSFRDVIDFFPLASICVTGKQILGMDRGAKWPVIALGTIYPAGRQFIVGDSGNSSIGGLQVYSYSVSITISNRDNDELGGN